MDMQDFNGLSLYRINRNVRERGKHEFASAFAMTRPATAWRGLQRLDPLIDSPNGRLGKLRMVLLQIAVDASRSFAADIVQRMRIRL